MSNKIIKSYKLHFDSKIKTRVMTKTKRELIYNISSYFRSCTNYIYMTNHEGFNTWKEMKKSDYNFIRKNYESEFGKKVTSGYAQNIYKFANDKYITTKKSFYSDYTQNKIKAKNIRLLNKGITSKKNYFKKPYTENFIEFPLDNRMLKGSGSKAFIKDEKVKNLYWLSILNPFKKSDYKKNINVPLKVYPEVIEMLNKGYKYSFSLHNDYIKINFSYDITIEEKKLKKIAVDFGKYISSYDGKKHEQWDLSRMYNKINRITSQIGNLQKRLQLLKDNNDFFDEYKYIKQEIEALNKRIKSIRKSTYGQIKNYLSNYKEVIVEDLAFNQIEKKTLKNNRNSQYKGKNFNKILRIMGRGIWMDILERSLVGNQLVKKNPAYSSQKCSFCGVIDSKCRKGRMFNCSSCGHHGDADKNASMNLYKMDN